MDLLFNELSIHEQFNTFSDFEDSLTTLMSIRRSLNDRFNIEIYHNGKIGNTYPIPGSIMCQAIGKLSKDKERSVQIWFNKFKIWSEENIQRHKSDEWYECCNEIVTDTSVGEAGFRNLHNEKCGLVSISPSNWCCPTLKVTWVHGIAENRDHVFISNYIDWDSLKTSLAERDPPIKSWSQLKTISNNRYPSLFFSQDCFDPLDGIPFNKSCASRFDKILEILNKLVEEHNKKGELTKEGHKLYNDYFTGDTGLFSDSSDTEKSHFKQKMTFPHPEKNQESPLFCTMHGKIRRQNLRLHFSWPVKNGKIYVVYAGPKITRR